MKPNSMEELIEILRTRGTIPADAEAFAPPMDRPWFVTIVLGGAGWLAGIFVLLFVMMLFSPDSAPSYTFAGFILLASAYGLYAADRDSAFFDQLALALSMAGQFSIAAAAAELTNSPAQITAIILALQCALLLLMPNRFARAIAAFFACLAWTLTIRFAWWGDSWLFDSTRAAAALAPALLGWFVIWIPLIVLAFVLVEREPQWISRGLRHIARPALGGTLLALTFGTFVSEPFALTTFLGPNERPTNWLALWPLLGVATALFAAFCAYRLRNHALLGCAIAGALLHVVHFYLVLGTTLLIKSAIMIAVGAILLIAARWLGARLAPGESS